MSAALRPITPEPAIDGLDDLIAELRKQADSGKLSAAFVVTLDREGCPDWFHTRIPMRSAMLGAIERSKMALIMETDE